MNEKKKPQEQKAPKQTRPRLLPNGREEIFMPRHRMLGFSTLRLAEEATDPKNAGKK